MTTQFIGYLKSHGQKFDRCLIDSDDVKKSPNVWSQNGYLAIELRYIHNNVQGNRVHYRATVYRDAANMNVNRDNVNSCVIFRKRINNWLGFVGYVYSKVMIVKYADHELTQPLSMDADDFVLQYIKHAQSPALKTWLLSYNTRDELAPTEL